MPLKTFDEIDWMTPESEEFANYWRELPRSGGVPHRSAFDPTKIVRLLPGIAMYEIRSDKEVVSRLTGTELVEFFGHEITGTNMLDLWSDENRGEAAANLKRMVEEPCGMILLLGGLTLNGNTAMSTAVGFPLLDYNDACNRLVFFSSGFAQDNIRVAREDQIRSLMVERSAFIDISS